MLQKEVIEAGEKIASDLLDAQISKDMGSMGGHVINDMFKYNNSDLIQKYLDGEIVTVEAIYLAMKRAEENGSYHNNELQQHHDEIPLASPCYWCINCGTDECAECGPDEKWLHCLTATSDNGKRCI